MTDKIAKVNTVSYDGFVAVHNEVQTYLGPGLPCFSIVGMANRSVTESRDRIRSIFGALGLNFPHGRIVVNLSPIHVLKEGNHYDLPIILSLLIAMEIIPQHMLDGYICVGELGLDGAFLFTNGVLPAAVFANQNKYRGVICPAHNGSEAALVKDIEIKAVSHLVHLTNHLLKNTALNQCAVPKLQEDLSDVLDFKQIRGQESAKRVMEIAAAGDHNVLLIGPPGAGKSMLARALVSILSPLSEQDLLTLSIINSLSGKLQTQNLSLIKPFRSPHHTSSAVALVGGGAKALPGEISLSHKGVLFLDELPEFSSYVLDSLREPLESGVISIARANKHVQYPADFQLVAAMNPCRCGGGNDTYYVCRRGSDCAAKYQARISGPFLDRLEIKFNVPALTAQELIKDTPCEDSKTIRARVLKAKEMQEVQKKNKELSPDLILRNFTAQAHKTLTGLIHKSKISARGYHSLLSLSRTIANLEQQESIDNNHLLEAFMYHRI